MPRQRRTSENAANNRAEDDGYRYAHDRKNKPPMTTKEARRSFQRWEKERKVRGLSEAELRWAARYSVVEARAQKEMDKEQRRRELKRARMQRAEEARVQRKQALRLVQTGQKSIDEIAGKTTASQTRLGAFFFRGVARRNCELATEDHSGEEEETEEEEEETEGADDGGGRWVQDDMEVGSEGGNGVNENTPHCLIKDAADLHVPFVEDLGMQTVGSACSLPSSGWSVRDDEINWTIGDEKSAWAVEDIPIVERRHDRHPTTTDETPSHSDNADLIVPMLKDPRDDRPAHTTSASVIGSTVDMWPVGTQQCEGFQLTGDSLSDRDFLTLAETPIESTQWIQDDIDPTVESELVVVLDDFCRTGTGI